MPSPEQVTSPILVPSSTMGNLHRRRSFDNTPQPSSSSSTSLTLGRNIEDSDFTLSTQQNVPFYGNNQIDQVPFPRGGRHIDETHTSQRHYITPQRPLSRSNSGEPRKQDQGRPSPYKKRHLFGRFTKKKSRNELNSFNKHSNNPSLAQTPNTSSVLSSSASSVSSSAPNASSNLSAN
ncbi:hypothetical protein BCR42DRAFT_126067, partial [Absidia repens]